MQAAREFTWRLADRAGSVRYLIRDPAGQFTDAFDAVFAAEGIEVLRSAPQCPRMNAYAERWVRTVRSGCTDRMLLLGQCHLEQVLGENIEHYNAGRAHRALDLRAPLDAPNVVPFPAAGIVRKPVLGGLISEYEAAARRCDDWRQTGRSQRDRGFGTLQAAARALRQYSGRLREYGSIRPRQLRFRVGAAQDRDFVAQREYFGVFGCGRPGQQREPGHHRHQEPVHEGDKHERRSCPR